MTLFGGGYDQTMPSPPSYEYCEMMTVAECTMSTVEAARKTPWAVHAYVRRQTPWLKRQPEYDWLTFGPDAIEQAAVLADQ